MPPPVPRLTITQVDGALGVLPPDATVHAKAGVAADGPINTPILCASRAALTDTFVRGPLVEDALYQLETTQAPVLVCRVNPGVAGALGSPALSGGGAPTAALTAAGGNTSSAVPTLAIGAGVRLTRPIAVRVRVATAGANFAALPSPEYEYSLDGGLTWSSPMTAEAGPVALGDSGLTLAWADGTFVPSNAWIGAAVPGAQQGTATVALSGAPTDSYRIALEILRGAPSLAANVATFRLSLDGGETWGPETAMPMSGTVQLGASGVTAIFSYATGTGFVAGDRLDVATTAPGFTLSDLQTAWAALLAAPYDVEGLHVVGAVNATTAAAVDTLATAAILAYRPRWVILEARDRRSAETAAAWRLALQSDFATFVSSLGRVLVAAGAVDVVSSLTGRVRRASVAGLAAARAAAVPLSEDLAWVGRGALTGVVRLHHDEAVEPGLNAARFVTACSHVGRTGYYLTNPNVMTEPGSDYELLQYRRVWDRAYRVLRVVMLPELSRDLDVNPADVDAPLVPGALDEVVANDLEARATDALVDALVRTTPRHATAAVATVDRTTDLLATRELAFDFSFTPKAYAKAITGRLGMRNPARS